MVVTRQFFCFLLALLTVLFIATPISAQDLSTADGSAEVNGLDIYYRTAGSGPPLLMMHGFTGAANWWDLHLERLAEHYTVIVPDLPGHGRSEGRSGPFRFDLVAQDLLALMSEIGFSRFHAIGYSAGGITLFHMATIDPDRIDAMVIVSAPHHLVKEDILAYPIYENHPPQVHSYWQDVHPGGEAQVSKLIESFHAVAEMTAEMSLSPEQLAAIEARTLYVGGDRDPLVPLPIVIEMYESVPDISLWILPEQGHSPIWPDWGGSENAARMFPEMVIRHLGDETLN